MCTGKQKFISVLFLVIFLVCFPILLCSCFCSEQSQQSTSNEQLTESSTKRQQAANSDQDYIKPATLNDFKKACDAHGLTSSLEPLMSGNDQLIGYSIKNNSESVPSNLIFYDVKTQENINQIYPTCVQGVTKATQKENVTAKIAEDKKANYEYTKATDFRTTDKFNMKLDFQIVYSIRVDCTCMYLECCSAEEEAYTAVAKDIGYLVD